MSLDAVNKFWEKVGSDNDFETKFVHVTRARIVTFAADHGFTFSEDDLRAAAENAQARVQELRAELHELKDHELDAVAGGTGASAGQFMTDLKSDKIYNRLGQVLDAISRAKSG